MISDYHTSETLAFSFERGKDSGSDDTTTIQLFNTTREKLLLNNVVIGLFNDKTPEARDELRVEVRIHNINDWPSDTAFVSDGRVVDVVSVKVATDIRAITGETVVIPIVRAARIFEVYAPNKSNFYVPQQIIMPGRTKETFTTLYVRYAAYGDPQGSVAQKMVLNGSAQRVR